VKFLVHVGDPLSFVQEERLPTAKAGQRKPYQIDIVEREDLIGTATSL
jgi:hypothetical protein